MRICVGKIVQHGILYEKIQYGQNQSRRAGYWAKTYEQEESSSTEEAGPDDGHNPVDAWPRTPTKPKQADRNKEGSHHSWWKSVLGFDLSVRVELLLLYRTNVPKERRNCNEGADQDPEKGKPLLSEVEPIDSPKDERK